MLKVKSFIGNPCEECTHIVWDETGEAVIIDCGAYYDNERKRLLEFLRIEGLRPVRLLLTHGHHDHVYGNDLIYVHYGLLPEVHEDDRYLMAGVMLNRIRELYKRTYKYPIPQPEQFLTDGQEIHFGTHVLRVIHVPGHSPGSVVFYCEEAGIAFTGDTLMKNYIGSTSLIGSEEGLMRASLELLLRLLPDSTIIYPGHGGKSTIAAEKEKNEQLKSFLRL